MFSSFMQKNWIYHQICCSEPSQPPNTRAYRLTGGTCVDVPGSWRTIIHNGLQFLWILDPSRKKLCFSKPRTPIVWDNFDKPRIPKPRIPWISLSNLFLSGRNATLCGQGFPPCGTQSSVHLCGLHDACCGGLKCPGPSAAGGGLGGLLSLDARATARPTVDWSSTGGNHQEVIMVNDG